MATEHSFQFTAIVTNWQIDTDQPVPDGLKGVIAELCEDFDRTWSRFRPDSQVTRIAHTPGGGDYEFPARDLPLLELYDRLVEATSGAVDPLVGRDLELLGYDAAYTLIPDTEALQLRISRDAWRTLRRTGTTIVTDRPVLIDVGAAGKGFLVDLIVGVLTRAGIRDFLVDGSGDLRHRGPEPAIVGLEHPTRAGRVIGTAPLKDAALCASAISRRAWGEGLHHVLDGRTGLPVSDVVATWTIASDAATADGLATALFVVEPAALSGFEFSWARMLADGRVQWSDDFPGDLFL